MSLTIEEMDDINVLLTEVSLELLGNQFYDIHGQVHESLRELYLPNVQVKPNYVQNESDLMRELMRGNSDKSPSSENAIQGRRSSIAAKEPAKNASKNSAQSNKPGENTSNIQKIPIDLVETEIKNNVAKELVRKLEISEESKIKYFQANRSRMASEYLDEYEIVHEFHANEKIKLMSDSAALIELIKYIKCDPANAHKIGTIAANILHVKDLI